MEKLSILTDVLTIIVDVILIVFIIRGWKK